MNYDDVIGRRHLKMSVHAFTDAGLFILGFVAGFLLRLGWVESKPKFLLALPGILGAAFIFVCVAYITGLYDWSLRRAGPRRISALGLSLGVAAVAGLLIFYVAGAPRVGRGVFVLGAVSTFLLCLAHHLLVLPRKGDQRERAAILAAGPADEGRVLELAKLWGDHFDFVGLVHLDAYVTGGGLRVLGPVSQLVQITDRERIQRIICTEEVLHNLAWCQPLCAALFSGVTITPLLVVCEEIHQCVPLDLVTPEWLLSASSQPHRFYLLKAKRVFDLAVSLVLLLLSGPLLLLAMLLVKLTSPGPVLYTQIRCGRAGRTIRITKLRTMREDAEKDGPAWSGRADARVTSVGAFLRRYRIDELLQLWSVLKGDISFVGPRPERPEFMEMLEKEIPGFADRLLVQPGLTGWAQVNHPYGATIEDARHKLEYDLYYMKHMGLYLDVLILLDTIRTVTLGGNTRTPPRVLVSESPKAGGTATTARGIDRVLGHS